jgi:uncharacterized protein
MLRHLMLVPSLACPAGCAYCFGPHSDGPSMSRETLEALARWQNALGDADVLEITFHGGEPLVPGIQFYRTALPLLRQGLAPRRVRFAMQSNLWLLTDELCDLFREYGVSLGTSLDGPELINDKQRGKGYFQRTMPGIERARKHGLDAGCICTCTAQSAPHTQEIFDFFLHEGLNFSIHAAVPSLRRPNAEGWSISPEAHGQLLVDMLERYLTNLDKIRISTLDAMCRSVSSKRGGICTFTDCLGGHLAVAPDGTIHPCQRFAGTEEYQLGNVHDGAGQTLAASPVWTQFQVWQEHINNECKGCSHLDYCRGGCPYNALAAKGGHFNGSGRDPHCPSYQRFFDHVVNRALAEVFSQENMEAVVNRPDPQAGLLRQGKLLALMRDGPHPQETAQHARRLLAATALAATHSAAEAAVKFQQLGLTTNVERTTQAMQALSDSITSTSPRLNNLYMHVTFACPLSCTHCYAQADPSRPGTLGVDDLVRLCGEAARQGFFKTVITGGEPLVHPQREALLDALARLRERVKPMLTTLRTSLTLPMDEVLLERVANSTDQVVVSVDGDRATHDARRGAGSYDLMVKNLFALAQKGGTAQLSLAAVLPLQQVNGAPGEAVRALAREADIRRVQFRPVLPLGRAAEADFEIVPDTLWGHIEPREMVAYVAGPQASCGMGQNLYVEPDGGAYPCYAWHGPQWGLGNVNARGGLASVLASAAFQDLHHHTVNSNRQCRICALRFLCGGACRAWNRQPSLAQIDLDAPPADCSRSFARARSLLASAMDYLGITPAQWQAVGLPLPGKPPDNPANLKVISKEWSDRERRESHGTLWSTQR